MKSRLIYLACLGVVFLFASCAGYVDRPKRLESWSFETRAKCPHVYKVHFDMNTEYYLEKRHIYTCDVQFGGFDKKDNSQCKQRASFFMDSIANESRMTDGQKHSVKIWKEHSYCMKPANLADADYQVRFKLNNYEPANQLWGILSILTVAIIPFRTTNEVRGIIEVENQTTKKVSTIDIDSKISVWFSLFLLPVQLITTVGDGDVGIQLIEHQSRMIYQKMLELEGKSSLHD